MRKTVSIFFMLCISESLFCNPITLIPNEMVLNKISENVIVATHWFPWESNSLIIITNNRNILLIDTPYTIAATEFLVNWITQEYKPQKIEAIVTGYHIDNIGGVDFLKTKNIKVIGTKLTNQLIVSESKKTLSTLLTWLNETTQKKYYDYYSKASMVKTSHEISVDNVSEYIFDNLYIELFYPGESHAKDNITVYLKNEKILFGSCIIKSEDSKYLGFTGDANLINWPLAVKKVENRYQSAQIIIPHHGKWGDVGLFKHTLSLF